MMAIMMTPSATPTAWCAGEYSLDPWVTEETMTRP